MTKVQIAVRISGSRDGQDWPAPGEIVDLPQGEADDLIRLGLAKPVERGVKGEPEKAVAPKAESRKGGLTKESTGL